MPSKVEQFYYYSSIIWLCFPTRFLWIEFDCIPCFLTFHRMFFLVMKSSFVLRKSVPDDTSQPLKQHHPPDYSHSCHVLLEMGLQDGTSAASPVRRPTDPAEKEFLLIWMCYTICSNWAYFTSSLFFPLRFLTPPTILWLIHSDHIIIQAPPVLRVVP